MIRWLAALVAGLLLIALPAAAQIANGPFEQRAQELVPILSSKGHEEAFFAPSFLKQIPAAQVRALAESLVAQNGPITGIETVERVTPFSGTVIVGYERARARINMTIDAERPNLVIGLLISAVLARDDSAGKVAAEFAALPGKAGLLVRRIDDPAAPPLIAVRADAQFAVGSAFKLWILAEAARAVKAGERKWSDVIPLGEPSFPSGITQAWPKGAPMTLHSLATLMISISDNSATDTLLFALGRSRVGQMLGRTGHSAPARSLPVLSTLELFALKMDANATLRNRWSTLSPDARQAELDRNAARLGRSAVDLAELAGAPRNIDTIEWFASPADLARTLDWLRRNGGDEVQGILGVNPGIAPGEAERFGWIGFKGGSEPGVISMNFIVQTKGGHWYSATGSWNDPRAAVDDRRFLTLMSRALALIEPTAK